MDVSCPCDNNAGNASWAAAECSKNVRPLLLAVQAGRNALQIFQKTCAWHKEDTCVKCKGQVCDAQNVLSSLLCLMVNTNALR